MAKLKWNGDHVRGLPDGHQLVPGQVTEVPDNLMDRLDTPIMNALVEDGTLEILDGDDASEKPAKAPRKPKAKPAEASAAKPEAPAAPVTPPAP